MSTFNCTRLAGSRMLVKGDTNEQVTVLSTVQFDELNEKVSSSAAAAAFDQAILDFYSPITDVLENIQEASDLEQIWKHEEEGLFSVVLDEGQPGAEAVEPQVIRLDHDTAVLRLIQSGDTDLLVWVGDTIEILSPREPFPSSESLEAFIEHHLGAVEVPFDEDGEPVNKFNDSAE